MKKHKSGRAVLASLRSQAKCFYIRHIETRLTAQGEPPPALDVSILSSYEEYRLHTARMQTEHRRCKEIEDALDQNNENCVTRGYCFVCGKWVRFQSSHWHGWEGEGRQQINWRENLICPLCGLNNRMRASVHLLAMKNLLKRETKIFLMEQTTPLFAQLQKSYPQIIGSEFLKNAVPQGHTDSKGIRNEDATNLTFEDQQFDIILSFDVLEHISDFRIAFAECARTLHPDGKMLFSVPFVTDSAQNTIRARLRPDNTIEHLLPPEYHGDPLSSEGCLCFYHFGWELLEQIKQSGFSSAKALLYWSRDFGYLGREQIQFIAEK